MGWLRHLARPAIAIHACFILKPYLKLTDYYIESRRKSVTLKVRKSYAVNNG